MLRGLLRRRSGFAQALAAFALLAMALRAFVPAGFMLSPTQDGRFLAVTLCSGHADTQVLMDLKTGAIVEAGEHQQGKSPADNSRASAPCVFAMAAPLAAPEAALILSAGLHAIHAEPTRPLAVIPGRGLAAPPPWSTGPPLSA